MVGMGKLEIRNWKLGIKNADDAWARVVIFILLLNLNSAVGRNHERHETHKKWANPFGFLAGEGLTWRVKSPDDGIPFVFVSFRVFRGFNRAF
jgi:hypothetical protein